MKKVYNLKKGGEKMKVESYEIKDKTGRVIRKVNYYSIHEVRKLYNEYLQNLAKESNLQIHDEFSISTFEIGNYYMISGTLNIWSGESTIKSISLQLPLFTEEITNSFDFSKLITRLEKKCKLIILALEDPDEVKGEIEDIEKTSEEEMITTPQLNLINKIIGNNAVLNQKLTDYINSHFGKVLIQELTKKEASMVISNFLKKENED